MTIERIGRDCLYLAWGSRRAWVYTKPFCLVMQRGPITSHLTVWPKR